MSELRAVQDRVKALGDAIDGVDAATSREARAVLRSEILALHREVEELLAEYGTIRDRIRLLGERFLAVSLARKNGVTPSTGDGARADELELSTHLERAWAHLSACRHAEALEAADRALARAPGNARAVVLRGWALMRLGRLDEASAVLEGLLASSSGHPLAHAALGYVAMCRGRDGDAVHHLTIACDGTRDRTAGLYGQLFLGMLHARRERWADARRHLGRALEMGPALAEAHWEMGRAYYLEGSFDLALASWRRGAEVNRYDPWGERCQEAVERANRGGVPLLLE